MTAFGQIRASAVRRFRARASDPPCRIQKEGQALSDSNHELQVARYHAIRTVGTLIASGKNMNDPENRHSHVLAAGDQGSDRSHDVVSRYVKLVVII